MAFAPSFNAVRILGRVRSVVVLLCVTALVVSLAQAVWTYTAKHVSRALASAATGTGGQFVPTQGRILDTRAATTIGGYTTPFAASTWRTVQVGGLVGVPSSDVSAVAVTFTVLNQSASGWIDADKDEPTPNGTVAYMNFTAGGQQSNSGVVAVSAAGKIQVLSKVSTDMLIDVQGYYTADSSPAPGGYVPVAPQRIVDTRNGTGLPQAKLAANSSHTINVASLSGGSVPAGASAAMLNYTIVNYSGAGNSFFWAYPADQVRPNAGFNFSAGVTDADMAQTGLSTTGTPQGAVKFDLPVDRRSG